jgi:uncharacterized cupredoxin-like copper-binding protein
MKSIKTLVLAGLIATTSGLSYAHGDEDHGTPAGAVKMEQKAWGIAGDARQVGRTISATMTDAMRFTPDRIDIEEGDTVRIVLENQGKLLHEFVIGTKQELDAHAALMMKFPNMEHDEPYMAHVPAGKTGELIWTFNRSDEFAFACLIAGHYEAGMVGQVKVAAVTAKES